MAQLPLRRFVKSCEGGVQTVKRSDIAEHEFVVLVGTFGCGKSAASRMVAGPEGIASGDIVIGGMAGRSTI